jgi:hypothetical protein
MWSAALFRRFGLALPSADFDVMVARGNEEQRR